MKTHFLDVSNLQEFETFLKLLYITTICRFKERLKRYNLELLYTTTIYTRKNELEYLIRELEDTIFQMEEKMFEKIFIGWSIEFCEQIRYINIIKHSNHCVLKAVFDIIFKYTFDIEYRISYDCCDTSLFKKLQFELLKDCRWKIIN